MNLRRFFSVILLISILAVIFYPSFAMGIVTLKITDSGALAGVPLYAKCSNVALHRTGEGEKTGWIELINMTATYNLTDLRNVTETLLRSRITAGRYDRIRFTLVEATAVVNGSKVNLSINQALTILNLEVSIGYGEERILLLDFKSNSTRARISRIYENSPTITVLK